MQRVRRLASVVAVATAGILALSACRSDPTVAAYVGDHEITEAQVSEIVEDLRQKVGEEAGVSLPTRAQVVTDLVLVTACEQISSETGYRSQPYAVAYVVQQTGLPADSTYVQRKADLLTCLAGLPAADPTEEELAELVDQLRELGEVSADTSNEEVVERVGRELLRTAYGQRRSLADAMVTYDVSVNPRYRPLEYPLLTFDDGNSRAVLVSVSIGEDGSGTVLDQR